MDEITKRCDLKIKKGRTEAPCGQVIPDGRATDFTYGGRVYKADLCPDHRSALTEALRPFAEIAKSTKEVKETTVRGRQVHKVGGQTFTTRDVREWMKEKGMTVASTGRIPNDIIEAYKEEKSLV